MCHTNRRSLAEPRWRLVPLRSDHSSVWTPLRHLVTRRRHICQETSKPDHAFSILFAASRRTFLYYGLPRVSERQIGRACAQPMGSSKGRKRPFRRKTCAIDVRCKSLIRLVPKGGANPHDPCGPRDFESRASASSATSARGCRDAEPEGSQRSRAVNRATARAPNAPVVTPLLYFCAPPHI